MIKKIKTLMISLTLMFSMGAPLALPAAVLAQECEGIAGCLEDGAVKTDPTAAGEDPSAALNDTITLVINIFSLVVGVVSVIMIIIGGLKYITSGGDTGNVTGAKNTILYAIVGLIIVVLAQIIVRFVLARFDT